MRYLRFQSDVSDLVHNHKVIGEVIGLCVYSDGYGEGEQYKFEADVMTVDMDAIKDLNLHLSRFGDSTAIQFYSFGIVTNDHVLDECRVVNFQKMIPGFAQTYYRMMKVTGDCESCVENSQLPHSEDKIKSILTIGNSVRVTPKEGYVEYSGKVVGGEWDHEKNKAYLEVEISFD